MKKFIIIFTLSFTSLFTYHLPSSSAMDAREIMQQVLDRDDGTTEISRVCLSTCRVTMQDKRYLCSEKPRVKIMDMVRKDYGPREKDHKTVTIVLEPASEKGIGFLQYDYDEKGKDSDQWFYLSALGKVKRVVSGNENEPKTGSFFGSELSYEDMEALYIEDYTYKLLGSEKYHNRDCWVVESVPTRERVPKSNYSKVMDWVDKERSIVLKAILFSRQGKPLKKIYYGNIETIDDILVPMQIMVFNMETDRRTLFTYEKILLNKDVEDQFLTQRTLTDGAFRESYLKRYQTHFN